MTLDTIAVIVCITAGVLVVAAVGLAIHAEFWDQPRHARRMTAFWRQSVITQQHIRKINSRAAIDRTFPEDDVTRPIPRQH